MPLRGGGCVGGGLAMEAIPNDSHRGSNGTKWKESNIVKHQMIMFKSIQELEDSDCDGKLTE